jgi:DnaK suppressor protein
MTKTDVQRYRDYLEAQRDEALRLLNRLSDETRSLEADAGSDSGDQSVDHLTRESLFLRGSQRRNVLRRIEGALDRIRGGTYGVCSICGDDIQRRRLEALPWTESCLSCQEEMEREKFAGQSMGRPT